MRSRAWGSGALTATRAEEGSALVRPTRNSSTSNWPPSSTTRSKTFLRMSESIRCPSRSTVSWTIIEPPYCSSTPPPIPPHVGGGERCDTPGSAPSLQLRKGQALLCLVLALLVRVGRLADLVALEEEHLRDPFPGVDPGGQGGRVRDLEGHDPLPLRLERGHVHDDAAARVGRVVDDDVVGHEVGRFGQGQVVDWLHSNEALCHHRVPEKVRVGDAAQGLVSQARRHLAGEGAGDALARLRALDPHLTERAALGAAGLAESVPGLRR